MSNTTKGTAQQGQQRTTRRAQIEQARLKRQLEIRRQMQRQQITRFAALGGGAVLAVLVIALIIHSAVSSGGGSTNPVVHGTGTYHDNPATGETRDNMPCYATEQAVQHIHAYLAIYVNGKQISVPANTGIPGGGTCFYPLHVHPGEDNIIHIESPDNSTFTLGAFFDIWGQTLSSTQVMDYAASASAPLTFEVFDQNGKLTKVNSNPLNIQLHAHETIVILYNSSNITPTPYTNWGSL